MVDRQIVRDGKAPKQQPLPHRQQAVARVAAAPVSKPRHHIPDEGSVTASDSSESDISTASKISSHRSVSKSGFSKKEELPKKCLVVRRSAPKKGVTKTEIRLVIYNETQKKEGLRQMEFPALMDASEMLADRLRDLETKKTKDTYQKEKEVRRQLEGEKRPAPTPEQEKEAIAKLKRVAPSLCNRSTTSDVTTATPIEPQSASSPLGSVRVSPSKKPHRNRNAQPKKAPVKPTVPAASTTVISDKDLDSLIEELSSSEKTESKSRSSTSATEEPQVVSKTSNTVTLSDPSKKKKKRRSNGKKKAEKPGDPKADSAPGTPVENPSKKKNKKKKKKRRTRDAIEDDDSIRSLHPKRETFAKPHPVPSEETLKGPTIPLRKPPPNAIRELKREPRNPVEPTDAKPQKDQEPPKDEEPKAPIESSEPRRPKKAADQPKDEEPKATVEPSEPRRPKKDKEPPKDEEPKAPIESSEPRRPKKDKEPPKDDGPKAPIESSEPRRPKKAADQPKDEEPKAPIESSEPRRPKKNQEPPKDEGPKAPIEPSEPRRPKKAADQPKDEEPKDTKGAKGPGSTLAPLCDRRDCCMQQPCVKKEVDSDPDQPWLSAENVGTPSGRSGKKNKKKKRTNVVLSDDTSATNNPNVEDSLYVLKRILKKLDSSNSLKLKNNPDREKVKASIEKIIRVVEGKQANGTKLNADDLDRMKRIVAKTAELRGNVSLTTTVTVTESVSVEDEDTDY